MRKYFPAFFTVCVFLAVMAFGIMKKQTYTDLAEQENYLEQLQVAELTENIAGKVLPCSKVCRVPPLF